MESRYGLPSNTLTICATSQPGIGGSDWRPLEGGLDDRTLHAIDEVREVCRRTRSKCADRLLEDPTKAKKLAEAIRSGRTIAAVHNLARVDRRLAATDLQWDRDPMFAQHAWRHRGFENGENSGSTTGEIICENAPPLLRRKESNVPDGSRRSSRFLPAIRS